MSSHTAPLEGNHAGVLPGLTCPTGEKCVTDLQGYDAASQHVHGHGLQGRCQLHKPAGCRGVHGLHLRDVVPDALWEVALHNVRALHRTPPHSLLSCTSRSEVALFTCNTPAAPHRLFISLVRPKVCTTITTGATKCRGCTSSSTGVISTESPMSHWRSVKRAAGSAGQPRNIGRASGQPCPAVRLYAVYK